MARSRLGTEIDQGDAFLVDRRCFDRRDHELAYIDWLHSEQIAHGVCELVLLAALGLETGESLV